MALPDLNTWKASIARSGYFKPSEQLALTTWAGEVADENSLCDPNVTAAEVARQHDLAPSTIASARKVARDRGYLAFSAKREREYLCIPREWVV